MKVVEETLSMEKKEINSGKLSKIIYKYIKKVLDFLIALTGIIILSPLMIIIAIVIKLDSKGPVLFKQDRTGKNGRIFKLYKFRSMVAENDVRNFALEDRETKVGKVIRGLSLDELPQLFNILKGDMAFIGPRPWIPEYYENMNEYQRKRCEVLPGITGLAQAKGRNNLTIFERIDYDIEYIYKFSFIEDIKIIFWSIKTVVSKDGAKGGKNSIKNDIEMLKNQEKHMESE